MAELILELPILVLGLSRLEYLPDSGWVSDPDQIGKPVTCWTVLLIRNFLEIGLGFTIFIITDQVGNWVSIITLIIGYFRKSSGFEQTEVFGLYFILPDIHPVSGFHPGYIILL